MENNNKLARKDLTAAQRKMVCDHMKATYPYGLYEWRGKDCPCAHCPFGTKIGRDWYDCLEPLFHENDSIFAHLDIKTDADLIAALRK